MNASDFLIYQRHGMRVYSANRYKAGGTMFIYAHFSATTLTILIIDAGLGFDANVARAGSNGSLTDIDLALIEIIYQLIQEARRLGLQIKIYGFVTHGHLDHVYGILLLSEKFGMTWHCSRTTAAMIRRFTSRREPGDYRPDPKVKILDPTEGVLELGAFRLEYFQAIHALPETLSAVISTPERVRVLHMAECRTKECSLVAGLGERMKQCIRSGCANVPYDAVFYDALREQGGITPAEDVIREPLLRVLTHPEFPVDGASLILPYISSKLFYSAIIQQVVNTIPGTIMAPAGASMRETTEYGRSRLWVPPQAGKTVGDRYQRVVVPCTGSQCEPGAALPRAIEHTARDLALLPEDWVMVIQGTIPHYRREVGRMYRNLLERCGRLVISQDECRFLRLPRNHPKILFIEELTGKRFVPSSGHGRRGDQDQILAAARCKSDDGYISYQSEDEVAVYEGVAAGQAVEPVPQLSEDEQIILALREALQANV